MEKIIDEIKELEENVELLKKNYYGNKIIVEYELAKLELEVIDEKDIVTNKPKYSNESSRKAALKVKTFENEKIKGLLNASRNVKYEIRLEEIKIDRLKRMFDMEKIRGL